MLSSSLIVSKENLAFIDSMSGGNYYISVDEIFNSLKIQRIKLFSALNLLTHKKSHIACIHCNSPFSDKELDVVDDALKKIENVTFSEKSALFYICGYICKKLEIACPSSNANNLVLDSVTNFTRLVSRGLLKIPPPNIFHFSLLSFCVFQNLSFSVPCFRKMKRLFLLVYSGYLFDFSHHEKITSKLINTFFLEEQKQTTILCHHLLTYKKEKRENSVNRR